MNIIIVRTNICWFSNLFKFFMNFFQWLHLVLCIYFGNTISYVPIDRYFIIPKKIVFVGDADFIDDKLELPDS